VGRGRPGEAARRYAQGLAIAERLVELDPGNTSFQRDLSISYNKLGDLDEAAGRPGEAARRYSAAAGICRGLLRREPHRADLAEELSVTLRLLAEASGEPAQRREAIGEIISVLTSFEQAGTITPKGTALLAWAHHMTA
jgi:tetratricopeptide (TPR) repeat protein